MKKIKLTQGKFALVDDEDFEHLNQWKWCYSHKIGAVRSERRSETGKTTRQLILMHREIIGASGIIEVDHKNLDKLDNRRTNLRLCDSGQNKCNRRALSNNKLHEKNICWHSGAKKFVVQIHRDKQLRFKAYFKTLEEAINKRDAVIGLLHGDFARVR